MADSEKRNKNKERAGETTDKINKTVPVTDVFRWCRRVTGNSRNVAAATKGLQENAEGTEWGHFLGLSYSDPLLSLCLRSAP